MNTTVDIKGRKIANHLPFTLIAGPCAMESEAMCCQVAEHLKKVTESLEINLIFKTSFDKANRTSLAGKRGIGEEEAPEVFATIKNTYDLPCLTDIHTLEQAKRFGEIVDVLQIPAFLSRQTDLLVAAGQTNCAVNIKKGQFMAPEDLTHASDKVAKQGNTRILLTERGTTFGYHNLVVDMRSLAIMARSGYPVVMDATHAVQRPSGGDGASSGDRCFVAPLARAAMAVGIAALFIETHPYPDTAFSDGANMLPLDQIYDLLARLKDIDSVVKA